MLNVRYYTLNDNGEIDRLILNDVTGDLWKYGVLDDIRNLAANLPSTKTPATAGDSESDGSDAATELLKDLRSVLVPTTSEILWGVINGDILQTVWNKATSSTGSLASIGIRQLAKVVGEPYASILNYVGGGATYVCYVNGQLTSYTTSIKYPVLAGGLAVRQEVNGSVKAMIQLMPMKIDKVGAASVLSGSTRYEVADNAQVYLWYKGQYYATKLAEVNSDDYYLTGWYDNFGCAAGGKLCQHHAQLHRRPWCSLILCPQDGPPHAALIPERCRCAAQAAQIMLRCVQPDAGLPAQPVHFFRTVRAGPYAAQHRIAEGAPTRIKQLPYPAQCPARGAVIAHQSFFTATITRTRLPAAQPKLSYQPVR